MSSTDQNLSNQDRYFVSSEVSQDIKVTEPPSTQSNNSLVEAMFEEGAFRPCRSNSSAPTMKPESESADSPQLKGMSNDGNVILLQDMFAAGMFRNSTASMIQRYREEHQDTFPTNTSATNYKHLLQSFFEAERGRYAGETIEYKPGRADKFWRSASVDKTKVKLSGCKLSASAPTSRSVSPILRTRETGADASASQSRISLLESMFSDGKFRRNRTSTLSGGGGLPLPSQSYEKSPSLARGLFAEGIFRHPHESLMQKYKDEHQGQTLGMGPSIPDEIPTIDCLLDTAFLKGALTRSAVPSTHESSYLSAHHIEPSGGAWNIAPLDLPRSESGRLLAASAPVSPGRSKDSGHGTLPILEFMFMEGQFRLPSKNNSFVGSEETSGRMRLDSIDEASVPHAQIPEIQPSFGSHEGSYDESGGETLITSAFASGLYGSRPAGGFGKGRTNVAGTTKTLGRI